MNNTVKENKRIVVFLYVIMFSFVLLLSRILYLQTLSHEFILEKALDLWSREIPVEGQRGNIYDRNGELIVGNKLAPSLAIIPNQIEDKEYLIEYLSRKLNADKEAIKKHVEKKVNVELIKPEGRKISSELAREIISDNIKGLYVVSDTTRYYPYGDMLSHVVGFTGIDNQGITGIEYIYDEYMKGESGALSLYTDAKGYLMHNMYGNYLSSTKGYDVYLTIDLRIQKLLERAIKEAVARYNPESIVLLSTNPKTGEVLGMASYPNFYPEHYQDYDQEVYNRNLPIWKAYEPGSVFKLITYATGLEHGVFKMEDRFFDKGFREVDGAIIKDWKLGGHGDQSFLEVLMNSCNPGFMEIGFRLGKEKLFDSIRNFGFGEKTGIDLLGESKGIVFADEMINNQELATSSFGQGNATTPIQLVNAVSAAANGGNLMQPYILKGIGLEGVPNIINNVPSIKRKVISQETSSKIRYSMEMVAAQGTGRGSYIDGYRVGGKTGTAQKVGPDGTYLDNEYILSYLGMAPMTDPEITVYAAVDSPHNTIQYGGIVSAPIVKQILKEAMPLLGIKKDYENQVEHHTRWSMDTRYFEVDDFIGKDVSKIHAYNYPFYDVNIIGNGSTVISQIPLGRDKIPEGSSVTLYTN